MARNRKGKNFTWRGADVEKRLAMGLTRGMHRATNHLKNTIVMSFVSTGATGTRSGGPGGSSPAGGPPAVQTGHLRRNVNTQVRNPNTLELIGQVGTGIGNAESVGYAVYLEYGTKHMASRPFLRPPFKRDQKKLVEMVAKGALK